MAKKAPKRYRKTINGLKNSVTLAMDLIPPMITSQVRKARPTPDIHGSSPSWVFRARAMELDWMVVVAKRGLQPMKKAKAPASQGRPRPFLI